MFGIPGEGWISLGIWGCVIITPWIYSLYLIYKINKSGVERWGAKQKKSNSQLEEEVRV